MDILKVEETIFTLLVNKFSQSIKTKYNVSFTSDIEKVTETNLPTVFYQVLPSYEVGNDLVNETINGVNFNFQIDAYSPKTTIAKEIINECVNVAKSMGFRLNALPYKSVASGITRYTIRCNRVIGNGDTL